MLNVQEHATYRRVDVQLRPILSRSASTRAAVVKLDILAEVRVMGSSALRGRREGLVDERLNSRRSLLKAEKRRGGPASDGTGCGIQGRGWLGRAGRKGGE
jgi:hypothetical protein